MILVDVRRHSFRAKPGHNLSREGVALARKLGADHPPVDLVVTSPLPRAVQTAVAMGFAVDEERRELCEMVDAVGDVVAWDAGFGPWAAAVAQGGPAAALARIQAAIYGRRVASAAGGRGLIVSHGGLVEVGCSAR
jgi:broad specificity phosphatase PhoE